MKKIRNPTGTTLVKIGVIDMAEIVCEDSTHYVVFLVCYAAGSDTMTQFATL